MLQKLWCIVLFWAMMLCPSCLITPASATDYIVTASETSLLLGRLAPGDVVTVSGYHQGTWRIPSGVAGTAEEPITLKCVDVILDASMQSGSAFVLSGNGQPLHLRLEGRLSIVGGRNNFYVSRSDIELAESAELYLMQAREDGLKVTFDVKHNPVAWRCRNLHFHGSVIISGAGQDGVDMGGDEYVFDDLHIKNPRDEADNAKNACAFRDKGSGKTAGRLTLTVNRGNYPYSVLSLGGRCDNSLAERWECANVLARVRFENVTTMQLIAFQAAMNCTVEAEAVGCTYQYGWRVVQEKVAGGTQLRSTGCLVNGIACDVALNGDLPPPEESELAKLQRHLRELSEHVEELAAIVDALVGHTHELTVGPPVTETATAERSEP